MEIRPPQKPNYPAIAEMLGLAFGRPWALEALANAVMADQLYDPNLVLVAREKGETLGFLHAVLDGDKAWIKLLAIHPQRRRQGLGREMLERLEERVSGEGAKEARLGFGPPPLFMAGVPRDAEGFFLKLGYLPSGGGSQGLMRSQEGGPAGRADAAAAHILIGSVAPAWWAYAEEQLSYKPPRLTLSRDLKAACFWEPGRMGPLFSREDSQAAESEAVAAALSQAGPGEIEFMDSRQLAWWQSRFPQARAEARLEMRKDLKGAIHA